MKSAIALVIIAIACVAAMNYVFYHSFPNRNILPEHLEIAIRESVFFVSLGLSPVALILAVRQWLCTQKEISRFRSGLGLTSLVILSVYCVSNFFTLAVIRFRLYERFDTSPLVELDMRNFGLLLLAIVLALALRRKVALLVIAGALLDHAFIQSTINV
jgi:hypothetical protein